MTGPDVSSERIVARIMIPLNRLLRDVNQAFRTELIPEELKEEEDRGKIPDAESSSTIRRLPTVLPAKTASFQLLPGQEGEPANPRMKQNSGPGSGLPRARENRTRTTEEQDAPRRDAEPGRGARLSAEPDQSTIALSLADNTPLNDVSLITPAARSSRKLSPGAPAATGKPRITPPAVGRLPAARPAPVVSTTQSGPRDLQDDPQPSRTAQDLGETAAPLSRVPLRRLSGRIFIKPPETGTDAGKPPGQAETGRQNEVPARETWPSRDNQVRSRRIIQGLDPLLERAHQLTEAALDRETPNDAFSRTVRNIFNVNVSLNREEGAMRPDREALQETILEMLRDAARRQGLEA